LKLNVPTFLNDVDKSKSVNFFNKKQKEESGNKIAEINSYDEAAARKSSSSNNSSSDDDVDDEVLLVIDNENNWTVLRTLNEDKIRSVEYV